MVLVTAGPSTGPASTACQINSTHPILFNPSLITFPGCINSGEKRGMISSIEDCSSNQIFYSPQLSIITSCAELDPRYLDRVHHVPYLIKSASPEVRCSNQHFIFTPIFEMRSSLVWASCQIRKIAGAHAPGMPGTFSPSPQVSDPDMHHGTCVTHVPWCMPGSPTIGFLWNRRRGKTFPAFPAHAQPAILRIW